MTLCGRFLTRRGEHLIARTSGAIALTATLLTVGCDSQDPCVRVGTNQAENLSILSGHVEKLGLPTTKNEIAYIMGTAYAASQFEGGQAGVPVTVCLRPGSAGDTEYRVLTNKNEGSTEWQSTADFRNR